MNQKDIKILEKKLKTKSVKWLKAREKRLEALSEEHYIIGKILHKFYEENDRKEKNKIQFDLINKTEYMEPSYPGMGCTASNGSAIFQNKEQAKALVESLQISYTYGYVLEWDGRGEYRVEPSYHYDHDRDVVYTATFKKV